MALQVGGGGLHALLEARGLVAERLEALACLLELLVPRGQRVPQGGRLLTELVHDAALRRNLALQVGGLQACRLGRVRSRLGLLPRGLEGHGGGLERGLGLRQLLRPRCQGLTVPGQVLGQGRERSGLLLEFVAQGELLLAEGLQLGRLLGDQHPVLVELLLEVLRELLALAEVLLQPLEPLAAGLLLLGALFALGLEGRAMLGEVALGVAQARAVPVQIRLQPPHHLGEALELRPQGVALGVEPHDLHPQLEQARDGSLRSTRRAREALPRRQLRAALGRDDRVPVHGLRVVARVHGAVVEREEAPREATQHGVVVEVELEAHEREPPLEVGVPDGVHAPAGGLEPALHLLPIRQAVGAVLREVAVLGAELVAQEADEQLLGLVDLGSRVRPGQDDVPARDPVTLPHERLAQRPRHVLEGVERRDHVEARVRERQGRSRTQDEAVLARGVHVHQVHPILGKELAQQRRPSPDVQDAQPATAGPQLLHQVRDQAIALVLVERELQDVHAQRSDSWRSPPRSRAQSVGRCSRPCCMRWASTTSNVAACSRWSMAVGAGLEWS